MAVQPVRTGKRLLLPRRNSFAVKDGESPRSFFISSGRGSAHLSVTLDSHLYVLHVLHIKGC